MPVLPDRPGSGRPVVSPSVDPASRPASVTRASRPVRRLTSRAYWSADVVETAIRPMRLVPVDGAATAGATAAGIPPVAICRRGGAVGGGRGGGGGGGRGGGRGPPAAGLLCVLVAAGGRGARAPGPRAGGGFSPA